MIKEISCFKAYDVRGRIPSELNEDVAFRIGVGIASYFSAQSVVIGYDIRPSSIDILEALTKGINKRSVAELTLSFMIGLCHNIFISAERMKRGEWIREGGQNISGKTIGIIGCGNVGKEVIKILKPFGCKILINDIEDRSKFCLKQGAIKSSFELLIKESDIVSLHVPLTNLTRDMINQNVLEDMKANAFLVNTSRGPVVNQSPLHRALVSKEILGAALDVFCSEPPGDIEFLQLPQLMVTPHIGGNSIEAVEAMGQGAIDNLLKFFNK